MYTSVNTVIIYYRLRFSPNPRKGNKWTFNDLNFSVIIRKTELEKFIESLDEGIKYLFPPIHGRAEIHILNARTYVRLLRPSEYQKHWLHRLKLYH